MQGQSTNYSTGILSVFIKRLMEFSDILELQSGENFIKPPSSLVDYLKNELLSKPNKETLFQFELNRLQIDRDGSLFAKDQEKVMLIGFTLIIKFLMIKLLMSPQKYNLGLSLNDSHLSNIKMLCTSLYYGGIRSFAMSAVPLKDLGFQND
jgi:hypothetical protein